jgi:hypothetical protein
MLLFRFLPNYMCPPHYFIEIGVSLTLRTYIFLLLLRINKLVIRSITKLSKNFKFFK